MGSPGIFIHSGTLGGRLPTLSLAPTASIPARPLAMAVPVANATLSCRNRRRDVAAIGLSKSVGSVMVHPQFRKCWPNNGITLRCVVGDLWRTERKIARQHLHADARITLQKLPRLKCASLSAS